MLRVHARLVETVARILPPSNYDIHARRRPQRQDTARIVHEALSQESDWADITLTQVSHALRILRSGAQSWAQDDARNKAMEHIKAGGKLKSLPKAFRDDEEIVLAAVWREPDMLASASSRLRNSEAVVRAAVQLRRGVLRFASTSLQQQFGSIHAMQREAGGSDASSPKSRPQRCYSCGVYQGMRTGFSGPPRFYPERCSFARAQFKRAESRRRCRDCTRVFKPLRTEAELTADDERVHEWREKSEITRGNSGLLDQLPDTVFDLICQALSRDEPPWPSYEAPRVIIPQLHDRHLPDNAVDDPEFMPDTEEGEEREEGGEEDSDSEEDDDDEESEAEDESEDALNFAVGSHVDYGGFAGCTVAVLHADGSVDINIPGVGIHPRVARSAVRLGNLAGEIPPPNLGRELPPPHSLHLHGCSSLATVSRSIHSLVASWAASTIEKLRQVIATDERMAYARLELQRQALNEERRLREETTLPPHSSRSQRASRFEVHPLLRMWGTEAVCALEGLILDSFDAVCMRMGPGLDAFLSFMRGDGDSSVGFSRFRALLDGEGRRAVDAASACDGQVFLLLDRSRQNDPCGSRTLPKLRLVWPMANPHCPYRYRGSEDLEKVVPMEWEASNFVFDMERDDASLYTDCTGGYSPLQGRTWWREQNFGRGWGHWRGQPTTVGEFCREESLSGPWCSPYGLHMNPVIRSTGQNEWQPIMPARFFQKSWYHELTYAHSIAFYSLSENSHTNSGPVFLAPVSEYMQLVYPWLPVPDPPTS